MASAKVHMEWMSEEILCCPVCYEEYSKPRILPCLHSFCLECLKRHYSAGRNLNNGKLVCPNCRRKIDLPSDGIKGLQKDKSFEMKSDLVKRLIKQFSGARYTYDSNCGSEIDASGNDDGGTLAADDEDASVLGDISDSISLASTRSHTSAMSFLRDYMPLLGRDSRPPSPVDATVVERNRKELMKHNEELCQFLVKARRWALFLYDSTSAREAKEEETIYKQTFPVKAMFELIEEVTEKSTTEEFHFLYRKLLDIISETKSRMSEIDMWNRPRASEPVVPSAPPPEATRDLDLRIGLLREIPELEEIFNPRIVYSDSRPDPKKISFKFLFKIGKTGAGRGEFDFPTHASFTPDGDILVSDKHNNRLQLFDKNGKYLRNLFLKARIRPRRAMVSPIDGKLYVCDEMAECVKVFHSSGALLKVVGEKSFQAVAGMTICPKLKDKYSVIVTDADGRSIVFIDNPPKKIVRSKGIHLLSDGKIPCTLFCASNAAGQIFVSDLRNGNVRVYEHDQSKIVYEISGLVTPRGLCVDKYGHLLVAESDKHQISLYNETGRHVKTVLTSNNELLYPNSIDINADGMMVVTQFGPTQNHEVLVFQMQVEP